MAARAAGASDAAAEALANEAATAKQEAADGRPSGARLDSAKAKVTKAQAKLTAADAAFEQAGARRDEARGALAQALEERAALEAEVARAPLQACPTASVAVVAALAGAEELLQAIEQSHIVALGADAPPEAVLARMRALRGALDAAAPPA